MPLVLLLVFLESVEGCELNKPIVLHESHLPQILFRFDLFRASFEDSERLLQQLFDVVGPHDCLVRIYGFLPRSRLSITALASFIVQFFIGAAAAFLLLIWVE